jgi:hypothetical protein
MFESLHPGWRLQHQTARLQAELLQWAATGQRADRASWAKLVDRLSHPDFQQRQAAHRELLDVGQAIVPFLATMEEGRLSAEQRTRLRQIQKRLTLRRKDTPMRVATWLAEDPEAWLALLNAGDKDTPVAATERLRTLCSEPIDFDPHASESHRQAQLSQLRRKLGFEPPPIIGDAGIGSVR